MTLMPPQAVGVATGVQNVSTSLAGIIGPIMTGWLLQTTGSYEAPMMLIFFFLVLGAEFHVARAKVAELYSAASDGPTRKTAAAPLGARQVFNLRQDRNGRSWNFFLEVDIAQATRLIQEEKPYIVIGSPP